MCERLREALEAEPERQRCAEHGQPEARSLAQRLPLVHRTVKPGAATLSDILGARRLEAGVPCTPREQACGIPRALYLLLGCAAFPEGSVAFLSPNALLDEAEASYTPFDTGSLDRYARPRDPLRAWDEPDKHAVLALHLGHGADAVAFCAEYLAAHFKRASDYVRRPQTSVPDYPAYHGPVSVSDDRRAWSIEIQLHEDLDLVSDHVEAIVLGQADLLADIPDDLVDKVVIAEDVGAIAATVQQLIISKEASA